MMKKFLVIFSITIFGCLLANGAPKPFNFSDAKKILTEVSSIDDFLYAMPDGSLNRYVLGRRTRSNIQHASPLLPRLILFPQHSDIVFSIGGDKHQKGGDQIELIHINKRDNRLDFYLAEFKSRRPSFGRHSSCFQCHQGRFIWDTYPVWPDAYGSSHRGNYWGTQERKDYERFLMEVKDKNPRYRNLPVFALSDLEDMNTELNHLISDVSTTQMANILTKNLINAPNLRFYLELFSEQTKVGNFPRIASFADQLPVAERTQAIDWMGAFKLEYQKKTGKYLDSKRRRLDPDIEFYDGDMHEFDSSNFNEAAMLEYVLMKSGSDLSIRNISSVFERDTAPVSDGRFGSIISLGRQIGKVLSSTDGTCATILHNRGTK